MRTLDDLPVVDSTGYPVDIGAEIDGGNGIRGEIVAFPRLTEILPKGYMKDRPPEHLGLSVEIDWPDAELPEFVVTQLAFVGGGAVLLCPEITSIDSLEAPNGSDGGRRSYEFNPN